MKSNDRILVEDVGVSIDSTDYYFDTISIFIDLFVHCLFKSNNYLCFSNQGNSVFFLNMESLEEMVKLEV